MNYRPHLLVSVIIDNYNYVRYLVQAIDSVLSQTYQEFELIIVDDGSTDSSRTTIEEFAKRDDRIKPVFKTNGGQASAFNAGFELATGNIVCFLDSDDYFAPNKLEEIVQLHKQGYDYIYTDNQSVNMQNELCDDNIKRYGYDGQNLFLVYYLSKYPGNVTSTISLSKDLANKIFPLPNEQEWRIQADDEIVFQASMLSRAKFLDQKLTYYRIHESNGHYGKKRSSDYNYELLRKRNNLKDIALAKMGITKTFLNNTYNLVAEFDTHRLVDGRLFKLYLNVLWFQINLPILNKLLTTIALYKKLKEKR